MQRRGEVGNKGRGLGASGRLTTITPKQKVPPLSPGAAQTCGNPGGPTSPAAHLGLIGRSGTMPSPHIQLRGKQVGPGQRRGESLGSQRPAFKGPASSKERLLVSIPSCPASISARCEFCCVHTSIPGGQLVSYQCDFLPFKQAVGTPGKCQPRPLKNLRTWNWKVEQTNI